ncbi:MAG: hypothetical protein E6767_07955 [Dysgonomonas sp.]|nr:hypothetical protein [Dysgonomonas sp.]
MSNIEKSEIDIHVKANTILINGKRATKSFISQIPLEYTNYDDIKQFVCWFNLKLDPAEAIKDYRRFKQNITYFFEIHNLITVLYINNDECLMRMYLTEKELKEYESTFGIIEHFYL